MPAASTFDFDFVVIGPSELEDVFAFCQEGLASAIHDSSERMLASWAVPWRREALAHYLPLGWSFAAREKGRSQGPLEGFFIAQPILFMRGQTQTLWIEHVEARSVAAVEALADVAVRAAREKHLQRALFNDASESFPGFDKRAAPSAPCLRSWLEGRGAARVGEGLWQVMTTKG